jgi:DNA-binding protein H-NS
MSSLIEIQTQIALLQKQAEEIRTDEMGQALQDILTKMDIYGITIDDIDRARGRVRKSSNPAPIKYRGPNGEAWSGRGLTPKWLVALIAQGQTKESFFITE